MDRWELLSDADNRALELDDQQLSDIAKPLAHIAERSPFGKKYGRLMMDSSDGVAAAIQLAMWANRVNRIARKVKPLRKAAKHDNRTVPGEVISEDESGFDVPRETFQANPGFNSNGHGYN